MITTDILNGEFDPTDVENLAKVGKSLAGSAATLGVATGGLRDVTQELVQGVKQVGQIHGASPDLPTDFLPS